MLTTSNTPSIEREVTLNASPTRYVSVSEVLGYVERLQSHSVPRRVAIRRAERKFGVDPHIIRDFLRCAN